MPLIDRIVCALGGRFLPINASENLENQRLETYNTLCNIYKELRGLNTDALELENLETLPVQIHRLPSSATEPAIPRPLDPAAYFNPLSKEFIRQRPMDTTCLNTQKGLDRIAAMLRPGYSRGDSGYRISNPYSRAGVLCDCLAMEMLSSKLNCDEAKPSLNIGMK